jgi:uncharacterized SAM-binding protein YcdF (DUF218 family)
MAGKRTAIVVPGHGWLDLAGMHRISSRCLRLVGEAEQLVSGVDADLVVFSGWSPTGGPSEAEQMRDVWRGPAVELVVEPTATSTAENAARTLPLLVDRGVASAIIVCAPPHLLRTQLLFRRLYSGSSVEVGFRVARLRPTVRAVAWELLALPFLPFQLHSARGELARRLS